MTTVVIGGLTSDSKNWLEDTATYSFDNFSFNLFFNKAETRINKGVAAYY
jgi:hypothetical protein